MLLRRRLYKNKSSISELKFVDLGLPSGTLWATTNIGAKTPYEAGLYFAWGETDGYKGEDVGTKHNFVLTEYKYYEGTQQSGQFTKYNANDQKTILDLDDDAAFINCGGDCRIPTKEQFAELINDEYVTKVYDDVNQGYIITSKINGNSIFLVSSLIAMDRPVDVGYGYTTYISNEMNFVDLGQQNLVPSACYAMNMHPQVQPQISEYSSRYEGYNIRPVHDRILTFTARGDNNRIAIKKISSGSSSQALPNAQLEYSLDNGKTWQTMSISNSWNTYYVTVKKGQTLKLRGINNKLADYYAGWSRYHYFIMTGLFEASGDVTSLLNNVGGDLSLADKGDGFKYLFKDCTSLITAPNLPSTTLCTSAYAGMFSGCTGLIKAPNSLPAQNVPAQAYSSMFMNCTSLTIVPQKLPATTLGSQFTYASMFKGCTSLTRAPEIANITYNGSENLTSMFQDCVNLSYVKAMFDPQVIVYTRDWLNNVSPTGVFVKSTNAQWSTGPNGIPENWTVETASE